MTESMMTETTINSAQMQQIINKSGNSVLWKDSKKKS